MQMKRLFIILISSIILPFVSFAQFNQEKKADAYFEELAYSKAVELYEVLYSKNPGNGKFIQRLAYSYNKMLNYKKAINFYSKLVQIEQRKVEDYYEYSQLLRIAGRIDESVSWLERYVQLAPFDLRAQNQYNNLHVLAQLTNNVKKLDIAEINGNTRFIDMCPIYYQNQIVFSTARDSFSMVRNNYEWNNQPFLNLYITKENPETDFTNATLLLPKFDLKINVGPACFTSDYKTMYFTRNSSIGFKGKKTPEGINHLKIFSSTFNGKDWSDPVSFKYNSEIFSNGHAALSPDDNTMYFVSNMTGGIGETDIYKTKKVNGVWSEPVNLGSTINTEGKEMFPFVDKNGILYFSSDGHSGIAGLDIYAAKELDDGTYVVTNMGAPLNSSFDDFGFIINADSLTGYFTSNRPGGTGDDDIYRFAVSKIELKVISLRDDNRILLPETKIFLMSDAGQVLEYAIADKNAEVNFSVRPGFKYQLIAEKDTYTADVKEIFIAKQLNGLQHTEEILLKQGFPYLTIEVINKDTRQIVELSIIDISEGLYDIESVEEIDNRLKMKMNKDTDYSFYVTAEGYFSKTVKYSSNELEPGEYKLIVELDEMTEGKQFVLEDLYYDLDKYNIRPDAALVLDELVKTLQENRDVRIEIGSHTDSRGNAQYNQQLSQRRSESVGRYLISKGIAPSRLEAVGYGESQLVNDCADGVDCPPEEHQQNRRTVIEILNKDIKSVRRGNRNVYYF